MDHQPFVADALEQVRGEHTGLDRLFALAAGKILRADHPPDVAGHLDLDFGELKLHRERVVEDQDPGIADGGPAGAQGPAGMDAGDIFLMRPDFVHLGDIEAFEGFVERAVGLRDLFYSLFNHSRLLDRVGYHTANPIAGASAMLCAGRTAGAGNGDGAASAAGAATACRDAA